MVPARLSGRGLPLRAIGVPSLASCPLNRVAIIEMFAQAPQARNALGAQMALVRQWAAEIRGRVGRDRSRSPSQSRYLNNNNQIIMIGINNVLCQ